MEWLGEADSQWSRCPNLGYKTRILISPRASRIPGEIIPSLRGLPAGSQQPTRYQKTCHHRGHRAQFLTLDTDHGNQHYEFLCFDPRLDLGSRFDARQQRPSCILNKETSNRLDKESAIRSSNLQRTHHWISKTKLSEIFQDCPLLSQRNLQAG